MKHATIGELRRMVDDSWAVRESTRRHARSCERCNRRQRRAHDDARAVSAMLTDAGESDPGVDLAWARLRRSLDVESVHAPRAPEPRLRRHTRRRVVIAGLGVVGALGATSAAAAGIVSVLSPSTVAPIQLGNDDVSELLAALPTATLTQSDVGSSYQVSSLSQADADTGLSVRLPAQLPSGVSGSPSISVEPAVNLELSFGPGSAGPAVGHGAVPSWLAGTTLRIHAGPAVLVTYESGSALSSLPGMVVGYASAPVLTATGATPQSIEDYVLSQPGISPALAAQMRVLGAPGAVLPVPVPAGATVSNATVGGAAAVVLADPSGFASGVIWEQGKTVRLVGGLISTADALRVANELG